MTPTSDPRDPHTQRSIPTVIRGAVPSQPGALPASGTGDPAPSAPAGSPARGTGDASQFASGIAPQPLSNASPQRTALTIVVIVIAGAAVSVLLGVYGSTHPARGYAVSLAGFSSPGAVKAWLATVVVVLAVGQDISALAMYGVLPGIRGGRWASVWHVWSGRLAVLVSIPVAAHCLYAFGFEATDRRVLLHSLLGCAVYGVFVAKMLLLTRKGLPRWVIPVMGGLLFTGFVALWFTSAVWYFRTQGFAP